jgi:hypothetical protein
MELAKMRGLLWNEIILLTLTTDLWRFLQQSNIFNTYNFVSMDGQIINPMLRYDKLS